MKRFWISWWEPAPDGDARPFEVPPTTEIPEYWMTGTRGDDEDEETSVCAVVDAPDEEAAERRVRAYWKPSEFRFCETKAAGWFPESDRFPRKVAK